MERVPYGAHKRRAFSMDNDWHGSERLSDSFGQKRSQSTVTWMRAFNRRSQEAAVVAATL